MGFFDTILNFLGIRNKKRYEYQDGFIDELLEDHQILLKIYGNINKYWKLGKYLKVLKLLEKFKYKYISHITYEDNSFYTYMAKKYENEPKKQDFILQKKEEMKQITKVLQKFFKRYNNVENIKKENFIEELSNIGKILVKRIEFEEKKLYLLYK